jgi:predicted small integral membrane protein
VSLDASAGKTAIGFLLSWSFEMMKKSPLLLLRASKILLVAGIGCLAFLVAFNNVVDYQSNFLFVRHVMTMDTVYTGNALMHRAITEPALHAAAYGAIILGEFVTAALCLFGSLQLLRHIRGSAETFNEAKYWAILGLCCGFTIWFFGFIVIGAEWFSMWQSPDWNGQEAAFRVVVYIILALIYIVPDEPSI